MIDKTTIKTIKMTEKASIRDELRKAPRLDWLFFELTDRCNLRCLHCGSNCADGNSTMLEPELIMNCLNTVAEDFEPNDVKIAITGGEPLLYPYFEEVIGHVNKLGFRWGMTTNGTLIDDKCAEMLKKLKLSSVSISLDGLSDTHDELRHKPGAWEKAIRGIKALRKQSIPVQITTVIHKKNFSQLYPLYEKLLELDIFSWRIVNIESIGRAAENSDLLLSYDEFKVLADIIRELRYKSYVPFDVRFGCSHYLSFEYENELRNHYFMCGAGITVASVTAKGDIFACLDIERRPELIQGNISKDRFSEVWYNRFKSFRKDRTILCDECRECNEKNFCAGDSFHTWDFENNRPMFCLKHRL